MRIIAIDPGMGGGVAWADSNGIVKAVPMPEGMTDQVKLLSEIGSSDSIAVMEKTGTYRKGNSGPSSVTFARHCGNLEAILYMLEIPTEQVAPQTWMKMIGSLPKGSEAKDKKERKLAIKEWCARQFPHLSVTLKTADALAIYAWRLKQCSKVSESPMSKPIEKRPLICRKG